MDSNLSLDIGFKGQLKLNAQAVPMQEGYLKLGGVTDPDGSNIPFGVVVSADPLTPNMFELGAASGNVVRGVTVFDDAIAQNSPAHPGEYLAGFPCAAIAHGFFYLASWTKTGSDIDPVIGCQVVYNTTTGAIEFLAAGASAGSGFAVLSNAKVVDVNADNGALVYLA